MADRIGQQFGQYRLIELVGQGSFADVYMGQHVRLPLQAAIKVLHNQLTQAEAEHFQQEAETIAKLTHPSIVRILDYEVQDGVPFLVMDYAPHGSLRRRYPKGTLVPLPQIVSSVKQVADALQYAHEQKFIHRDVKPENLLVGRRLEVLLSDFGIATIAHSTSSLSASAEGMSGTLAYMAPEQIEGHQRPASDQYALGVVVYEWLCGERPFEGSVSELIAQHLSMPPPSLHERVPAIPAEVEQVVLRALNKAPKARFAGVQDFALALEEACRTGHTLLVLPSVSVAQDLHASTHNLLAPLTPLLGREQEVAIACTLLRRPEVRLVTLTGTGGVGKTRLATAVATEVLADFPGGVFLVSLAPISDPALVIPTIAQVLDVKENGARPLLDLLIAYLRGKHLLLCLDNFEQLLPAAPKLSDLLARCTSLKMLVTSRAVLHIQGEHEFLVPPLAVPDLTVLPSTDTLPHYPAVALFLQRAQAIQSTFRLTSSNARPIAEICIRLDGLPLAIELAAKRIRLFLPQALLAQLEHRLSFLTGGARDVPQRQRTLRDTIAWSYQLLDNPEQHLIRRIAVFVGGCTLGAVEAVCVELGDVIPSVLDGVESLIDKNLLQQTAQEEVEPRLMMLETIREYALEALESSGEMATARQAHATYYLALAEEAARGYNSPQFAEWLERLEREHDNLRATMEWSLDPAQAGAPLEMAYRLAEALTVFWSVRGYYSEARTFLERVLAHSEGGSSSVRARTLNDAAGFAYDQDDYDRAETLWHESLTLYRELGDTRGIASTLKGIGLITQRKGGNIAALIAQLEESLALNNESGDLEAIARSLYSLAESVSFQGDYKRGYTLYEESLTIYRELRNKSGIAVCLMQSALYLFFGAQGDQATVHKRLEESLAIYRELGDKLGMAYCFWVQGWAAFKQGDTKRAHDLIEQSLVLLRETGSRWYVCGVLAFLGRIKAHQGDFAAAHALLEESLAEARTLDDWSRAFCLERLAVVVEAQGEHAWVARLLSMASALREQCGIPVTPMERTDYEPTMTAARTSLGEQAFAAAWDEGRSMTFEQVLTAVGRSAISSLVSSQHASKATMKQAIYPVGLTDREMEVLRLVALGLSNADIAEKLVISLRTVKAHMHSLYNKLGVSSRSAATRYAIEHQLV